MGAILESNQELRYKVVLKSEEFSSKIKNNFVVRSFYLTLPV